MTLAAMAAAMTMTPAMAQMGNSMGGMQKQGKTKQPPLSPPAKASVMVAGASITIDYSAPSMRGRKIFGGLVPYGVVWRTGANAATTLKTSANLKIGSLTVPAGTYTLYSMPGADAWKLIVNKQTGQWGTVYHADQDLGRVDLKVAKNAAPVEKMKIEFGHTQGSMTMLHIAWADLNLSVPVTVVK
jgi:hypothetical protein